MADDKNFKELLAEQKRFTEEQKKATIALNKLAEIETPDNTDVVAGLDKLGKDIKDGNKKSDKGDIKTQHGYDTSEKNKFVMEKKAIEDRRKAQDEFQKAIEKQGGDVKNNYAFQREQTKITKADFALKRKLADTPGSKKELKKEEAEALKDAVTGPLQRGFKGLTGAFGKLSGVFKSKFGGSIKTLGSLLKFGLGGLALLALSKFLQSETWKNWKEDLIPNLVKAFEVAGDILGFIFRKISNGFKAVKALFGGFFDEDGFKGGFKQLFENIGCIGPAILGIGLAFAGVAAALSLVGLGIVPRLIFGGLRKGGKWIIAKPFMFAFKKLGKLLGLGGAKGLAGGGGGLAKAGFWSKTVKTAKSIFSGVGNRFTNLAKSIGSLAPKFVTTLTNTIGGMFAGIRDRIGNLAKSAAKIAAPVVKAVTTVAKPIAGLMGKTFKGASKGVKSMFGSTKTPKVPKVSSVKGIKNVGKSLTQKFPNFGKLLKIAKKVPFVGKMIMGGMLVSELASGKPAGKMIPDIAGLFGSFGGAALGGGLGTALGLAGGPLALITGLLGGIGGAFMGDKVATAFAQWLIGEEMTALPKWVRKIIGGGGGDAMASEGGGGDAITPTAELSSVGGGGNGILPKASTNGGGNGNYNPFPGEGGGSTPVPNNTIITAPVSNVTNNPTNQMISKGIVEPDAYFLRQSGWAI